jgi:hypothetical protein
MYKELTTHDIAYALSSNKDNGFTYQGARALAEYLEELEESLGEEFELDAIAICCDFNMLDAETIASEYRLDIEGLDDEEVHEAVMEYLNDNTIVLGEADGQIIYGVF